MTTATNKFAKHAKIAKQNAEKRMGAGWSMLAPEMQEALILREAALLVMAQDDEEKYGAAQGLIQAVWNVCPEC